ncbi:MAG: ABC transporter ATP-binding protein [Candidatus Bipolaricaulota bacterium]|nr:ABC transporter ATP-binding protein [Candidatus Bipolaricaulota bacterium]MDW8126161.1 ABC transporter ATP-binding protein [Candidatus Bipolaricaulota bacterium]
MKKVVELQNVTKIYSVGGGLARAKIIAVDNVSFHLNLGEIFGLAGESGCGKTTTARIILGFEKPTSGTVVVYGLSPTRSGVQARFGPGGIQAVFQNPFETFNPLRLVEAYFFETVKNYRLAQTKRQAAELIEDALQAVGLSYAEVAERYPSEFSGGQLQRIAIARALLTKPRLLIADEPVSMVDASLRISIVNLFRKLRDELGMAILYITHDLATAYYICDRIALMFRGNLVEMGEVSRVLGSPRHPYTRLLTESIPKADPTRKWTGRIALLETEEEEYRRKGCKFAGRCPTVMEECKYSVPPDSLVDGVLVKCFLYQREGEKIVPKGGDIREQLA